MVSIIKNLKNLKLNINTTTTNQAKLFSRIRKLFTIIARVKMRKKVIFYNIIS